MMLNKVSLNTIGLNRIGLNRIGKPSRASSDRPYIDPEVLASLKAVCICYGKSNDDPDRAVVKNLVDPDNPFVISNAAYTEGSGYADKDSPYYGAFVTDGIDDLITSTKTLQEMLGGSNEITVVSMMANLDSIQILCNSNYNNTNGYNVRNTLEPNGVISMLGYTDKNGTTNNLNLIMGDKDSIKLVDKVNFNSDYVFYPAQYYGSYYQVAWYWTFIANRVLTTDEINQVIAYYNLDRTLKPDILCNVKRQRITNENHAEFGDKLIDFSGNGRDIQLNNIAWKGDSGIGKYEMDFLDWAMNLPYIDERTSFTFSSFNDANNDIITVYQRVPAATQSFKIKVKLRGRVLYRYYVNNGDTISVSYYEVKEGINILPDSADPTSVNGKVGFILKGLSSVKVEQIPSHAGALCLDGVNDFGKVTGMPIYKDYTVVTDREIFANIGAILSKNNPGAFVETAGNSVYSFGQATSGLNFISTRSISYLSKYSYCGQSITAGAAEDGTDMWLGTIQDNDTRFFNGAIYSLMSFPYSMSEFLIERQLKKHKLGTLYPDMVEFRPIVNSNVKYQDIIFRNTSTGEDLVAGQYYDLGTISIFIKPLGCDEATAVKVNNVNAEFNSYDKNTGYYRFDVVVTKSPQKIDITIYQPPQYLTMLSNSTLISNETLIKNE